MALYILKDRMGEIIMDYEVIRVLAIFIVFIIMMVILIRKRIYSKILSKTKYSFITIFIILNLFIFIGKFVWDFPYEGTILKFSKVDNIITHFIEKDKIIKKYVFDDYAYVLYNCSDDSIPKFMSFSKNKNGNWKAENMSYIVRDKIVTAYDSIICISKIPSKNSVALEVYYPYVNKNEKYKISDSLNSKFDTFIDKKTKYNDEEENRDNIISVVIIDGKVDKNYTLYLNGKKFKPFK